MLLVDSQKRWLVEQLGRTSTDWLLPTSRAGCGNRGRKRLISDRWEWSVPDALEFCRPAVASGPEALDGLSSAEYLSTRMRCRTTQPGVLGSPAIDGPAVSIKGAWTSKPL